MRISVALLVLLGADGSPYLERDLDRVRAEYLVVAPPAFVDALDPLCAHRAKAYSVAIVRTDDVARRHGRGPDGVARLVADVKPRFLLLAGDAEAIPPYVRASAYTSEKYASDRTLATDHLFGGVVGRMPADTPGELAAMIEKTIEYETALQGGAWQKKMAFVIGVGGFGGLVDAVIEKHFKTIVTQDLPAPYDLELAYAKPSSPYCAYPPKFNENVIRLLNDGALFFVYIGHGLRHGFDEIPYKDRNYPILRVKDVASLDVRRGRPVMIVLACDTGKFDPGDSDCIGEELMKRRGGPVAFIGGSRITQPYGNALLGRYLVQSGFDLKIPTLGEVLWKAKEAVTAADTSLLRRQADALATMMQGPGTLGPMRKDVILHYNLLGDPALRLRRVPGTIDLEVSPAREFITVMGAAKEGPVELTFECARDAFCHPTDLKGKSAAERVARRYRNANNKVIRRSKAALKDGLFDAVIDLPKKLEPGTYWVKAYAPGAFGAARVVIEEE